MNVFKEIILVDNCSTDSSKEVNLEFGKLENVIFISACEKQGKGHCFKKGLHKLRALM